MTVTHLRFSISNKSFQWSVYIIRKTLEGKCFLNRNGCITFTHSFSNIQNSSISANRHCGYELGLNWLIKCSRKVVWSGWWWWCCVLIGMKGGNKIGRLIRSFQRGNEQVAFLTSLCGFHPLVGQWGNTKGADPDAVKSRPQCNKRPVFAYNAPWSLDSNWR